MFLLHPKTKSEAANVPFRPSDTLSGFMRQFKDSHTVSMLILSYLLLHHNTNVYDRRLDHIEITLQRILFLHLLNIHMFAVQI